MTSEELADERLGQLLSQHERILVAFSGGLDSSYLTFRAHQVAGAGCLAVLAQSPAVPPQDVEAALAFAHQFSIPLEIVPTNELANPAYRANHGDRCFHCKSELFGVLRQLAESRSIATLAYGAITDDLADYRPGARAAQDFCVIAPLQEAGLSKEAIRRLSKSHGLPSWDRPASPCLASRIAYGETVTPEKLQSVQRAEQVLQELGLARCRIRHHREIARIEVPKEDFPRFLEAGLAQQAVSAIKACGFLYVTLDLEGLRSGSLNLMLPVVA